MSRLPIRLRLTLAFAAAMAVVLAVLGIVVYSRFEDRVLDSADKDLRSRATDIEAVLERSGPRLPSGGDDRLVEHEESFAQLVAPDGRVIDVSQRVPATPLLSPAEIARVREEHPVVFARERGPIEPSDPVRLLGLRTESKGRPLVLVVGRAMDDDEESLATLRLLLLVGLPVALLLASAAGYAVAAAALRPVEAMRRKAAAVSEHTPGERLPVSPARDEVGRLGETLNAMLARLEAALEHERGFVADASHELRTPLAILKTELELALRRGRSEDELRSALESASEETERLTRLAEDLLVLARADRGALPLKLERLSAGDLLGGVARRFRVTGAEPAVEDADGIELRGDRLRLEQALANLVANAATHGGGRITLSARTVDGAVELHVEDDGPGLPEGFAERAFERFSRADPARGGKGAGLGLAIVDAIARAHGGRAGIANRAPGVDAWIAVPAHNGAGDA